MRLQDRGAEAICNVSGPSYHLTLMVGGDGRSKYITSANPTISPSATARIT